MAQEEFSFLEDYAAMIGEAPLWSPRDRAMYWIDNIQKKILRTRAPFTSSEMHSLFYRPSCLNLLADGGLLVGYRKGIGLYDFDTEQAVPLPLPDIKFDGVNFNDGAVDPAGRLWIGSKDRDALKPLGSLYRMGPDAQPKPVIDGIVLSNGMGWSPDGCSFYYADSRPGRIDAFDFDVKQGTLSNLRTFVDYAGKGRRPDGLTVDAEGFVWVAEIDGWRIARYAPDGRLDREVMLPIQRPTSLAFGGEDMSTLFVTSMRFHLNDETRAKEPKAGMLLHFRPGVKGQVETSFRGLSVKQPAA